MLYQLADNKRPLLLFRTDARNQARSRKSQTWMERGPAAVEHSEVEEEVEGGDEGGEM